MRRKKDESETKRKKRERITLQVEMENGNEREEGRGTIINQLAELQNDHFHIGAILSNNFNHVIIYLVAHPHVQLF